MSPPGITVVGVGAEGLVPAGRQALAEAVLVAAGQRHLDAYRDHVPDGASTVVLGGDLEPALDAIEAASGPVAVIASGDPGFFGIVRTLTTRVDRRRLRVLPAVSSVAAAFAAAGVPWDDAIVVSAHGRDPASAVHACLAHSKVAVLTAPGFGPVELARALRRAGCDERTVLVAERLGEPDARIVEADLEGIATGVFPGPNVVVVLDERAAPPPRGVCFPRRHVPEHWALDPAAFAHQEGMVSKPEVRALALAALGPGVGDLVWDVGAGSGAVAVECARFGAAVVAVERDADACALVAHNAAAHDVAIRVIRGTAPAALGGLPDPDATFVGGGGRDLPAILVEVLARTSRAVAVALATVERVAPTLAAFKSGGWDPSARMLYVADLAPLPGGHRLAARNPVFLVAGRRLGNGSGLALSGEGPEARRVGRYKTATEAGGTGQATGQTERGNLLEVREGVS
ncbi:MAG: precorrin-6y C5,15-methyltransferase (decarboxylating) subunit CbiE [Actinomycetota bacterium]|nr:precorrin-6y C5,15-methyltransferase (decarboxylating) subunit CbiE [Actinomycetota bacterium]